MQRTTKRGTTSIARHTDEPLPYREPSLRYDCRCNVRTRRPYSNIFRFAALGMYFGSLALLSCTNRQFSEKLTVLLLSGHRFYRYYTDISRKIMKIS